MRGPPGSAARDPQNDVGEPTEIEQLDDELAAALIENDELRATAHEWARRYSALAGAVRHLVDAAERSRTLPTTAAQFAAAAEAVGWVGVLQAMTAEVAERPSDDDVIPF